jgi:hypothetical protein
VILYPPEPIKLAQFDGSKFVGDKLELNKIVREMNDNPNDQLYVYFAYKQEPAGKPAQERERHAVDYLAAATGDLSRITVVRIFDGVNLVQFWRVPPGADNPICRECDESVCPVISVTGPAGIWVPGERIQFAVSLEGNIPPNVAYQWSISEGEIADGQGTANIAIRTKPSQSSLTATIEIKGLPKECPNVASETGGYTIEPVALLVDESSVALDRINKRGLDKLVEELKRKSTSFGYIIEYVPPDTSQKTINRKIKLLSDYLGKTRGIDRERFKIIFVEFASAERSAQNRTKLYAIPPGADFPAP